VVAEHICEQKRVVPLTVLIVEDNQDIAGMLRLSLKTWMDMRVFSAKDGGAALRVAQRETPDLILMDIAMPYVDGLEATRHLKADATTKHIPIIAMSNYFKGSGWQDRAIEAGCVACIDKSIPIEAWRPMIMSALKIGE
jgi:CheY-like chemotaxis protein